MKTKAIVLYAIFASCTLCINAGASPIASPPGKSSKAKNYYTLSELQKNLEYDFARTSIRKGYYERLDKLAEVVNEKQCAVALRGNADSIGTYKGNWVISQKRSDAVKKYLISKGVPEKLIVSTAFGSTVPLASNRTAAGRQQNRRVEIKLKENN